MDFLIVILLTLLNGLFALSEIALVSVRKHNIEQKADAGSRRAKIVLELLETPEHFLSSIQVGITFIGIIAGAYGAAALADDVEPLIRQISFVAEYSQELSFTIVIMLITYFSIVLGELIPKSVALNNPDRIALMIAPFIRTFTLLSYPLVRLLSFSTRFILKLLGIKEAKNSDITEEELMQMLKTAGNTGVIENEESFMHQNIFTFSEQKAKSLKTHRTEVEWINIDHSLEDIREQVRNSSYSKFPVCKGSIDEVVGVVTAKDFFEHADSETHFMTALKKPIYIPEMMNAIEVLRLFKTQKEYLGIVIDEYGSFEGIVTLHDLIEAIVGDLPDIDEELEIHTRDDGSVLVDGSIEISTLNAEFEAELISESPENYLTLAGFVIYFLERIPTTGEQFEYNGHYFEIIDLDGNRIDKLIIKKLED